MIHDSSMLSLRHLRSKSRWDISVFWNSSDVWLGGMYPSYASDEVQIKKIIELLGFLPGYPKMLRFAFA
jgi:hypothetical protein